jgi:hypothetical protein
MKATDRSILIGLVVLGLLACFWFMLLSPKRDRAAELEQEATDLQADVTQQEQVAAAAEQAQGDYAQNYERLIVLGKAAPADGDTPSFLAQLTGLSEKSGTAFESLTLSDDASAAPTPAAEQTTTDQNAAAAESAAEETTEPAAAAPVVPTEASAATLPLGATIGPAGLGVMPYSLRFTGDFFEVADLLQSLDSLVGAGGRATSVDGRLVTVNGFTMAPAGESRELAVDLLITTYVLPDSQGLTAGATPAAPAPTVPEPTPVSTSTTPAP